MPPPAAERRRLKVVTPPAGATLDETSRLVADRNGGEVVRGWTEAIHVLRRRSAALDARALIERGRRAQMLADRLSAVDDDLAAAERARAHGDPLVADALRALAVAAERAAADADHWRARIAELEATGAPRFTVPAAEAQAAAQAAIEAHRRAAAVSEAVGPRPPYEPRLHQAATAAAWRLKEAQKVERWAATAARVLVTAGVGLAVAAAAGAPLAGAPVAVVALAAVSVAAWIGARIQQRQDSERLERVLFRSGVGDVAELETLAERFRQWEANTALVAETEAERARALAAWTAAAPGADLADAVQVAKGAGDLAEAQSALPRARRRLELCERKHEVAIERWAAELAELGVAGPPSEVERIVAELLGGAEGAEPSALAAERDRLAAELDAVLDGAALDELAAAAERAETAFAPLALDATHRPLVVEIAHPAPSRRHEQEMLDEIERLGARVETVLVAERALASAWGLGGAAPDRRAAGQAIS